MGRNAKSCLTSVCPRPPFLPGRPCPEPFLGERDSWALWQRLYLPLTWGFIYIKLASAAA